VTAPSPFLTGFSAEASIFEEQAVLAVFGEIDVANAPELDALLEAVTLGAHVRVVLDLAELSFIDAAGLRVIADRAGRFELLGGSLTIRSPSAMVLRLLDITGWSEQVRVESPRPVSIRLGPEQRVDASEAPVRAAIYDQLKMITAISCDDEVVDRALNLVVALAGATVGGADGVSVSLRRHGRLSTVAASDQTILDMDAIQYATGEGPCVDASVEGRWFHIESLEEEHRWPSFTPGAQGLGINAILSSPLLPRGTAVGALNIYSRRTGAFGPNDQRLASTIATEASVILSHAELDATDEQMVNRFQEALRTREVIAQAQGVIMERDGVSEDDSFDALRQFSVWNGRPLFERAHEVVASTWRPLPHLGPEPPGGHHG